MMKPHPLYLAAEAADQHLSIVIRTLTAGKRDRWTMTAGDLLHRDIRAALDAKYEADHAWLTFLRDSRSAR